MKQNPDMLENIRRVTRLFLASSYDIRAEYGLSAAEYDVLAFLANNPLNNTASEIAGLRMLPKANVSVAVEALMRKGYIERSPDKSDRRRVRLLLTPGSRELARRISAAREEFLEQLFKGFSAEEVAVYQRMNARIAANAATALKGRNR